jgi:hypothetical protein
MGFGTLLAHNIIGKPDEKSLPNVRNKTSPESLTRTFRLFSRLKTRGERTEAARRMGDQGPL